MAQLAPSFFGALFWQRGTASGAIAGMTSGILVWAYTLLIPSMADAGIIGREILVNGPWDLSALRPQALFGLDLPPLVHGVLYSLSLNLFSFIVFSLSRPQASIERLQADLFVPSGLPPITPSFRLRRSSVTVQELTTTVAHYLGDERTRTALSSFAATRRISLDPGSEAGFELLRYAEHILASAIGAASSRLVLSLLLRQRTVSTRAALKMLDDANAAIHYNREILQSALDHVRQGIAVFDKGMHLVCWNNQFGELLGLPHEIVRLGATLEEILRFSAERQAFGPGDTDALVRDRLARYTAGSDSFLERFPERALVIEVRANRMPGGGTVTTFTDITPTVETAEALEKANETLERRVRERTKELERLNAELALAKATAEDANISKTRFLAAASHDILQPLNAARLYVTSLVERYGAGEEARLVGNVDASLEAIEEILGALLDISRLDAGAMKPEFSSFRVDELLRQLAVEFAPQARERGLDLVFVPCSLTVRSDRRLLRRLLQNLVSNAIKYTQNGRVLVGCRRLGGRLRLDVYDTGLGIPESKRGAIFKEFHRLDTGARVARGLGLGLSIVERIARVLNCEVEVRSVVGQGSHFSVAVPLAPAVPGVAPSVLQRGDLTQLSDLVILCIDNESKILDGMEALLSGWGCKVMKASDLNRAIAITRAENTNPTGLLVDFHLDEGDGISAIIELRRSCAAELPAILITADRGAGVRTAARLQSIQVLYKPIKPAALRALLAQWRVHRVAAE